MKAIIGRGRGREKGKLVKPQNALKALFIWS
jgi:hypothetical protein